MADQKVKMILTKKGDNYYIDYENMDASGPNPDCPPYCKAEYELNASGKLVTKDSRASIQEIEIK